MASGAMGCLRFAAMFKKFYKNKYFIFVDFEKLNSNIAVAT